MPHIYPPAPPVLTGDVLTISRFLNAPALVQRRLATLAMQRFIADVLLSGRYEVSGGSIIYEQTESILTDNPPEAVSAGAEYPRSPASPGPAAIAGVTKWGQDVPITDEHVHRYGRRAVDTALLKVTNYLVKQVDTVALTAINLAVTQNFAATTPGWSPPGAAGANPFYDLMRAVALIIGHDEGYDADVAAMSDLAYANLLSQPNIIAGLAREAANTVTTGGISVVQKVANLNILPTNNLPVPDNVFVADSQMLGGMAFERLESPEYQGDPANGIESWTRRDPDANDQWLVRGRRPVVPIVQEPQSAVKITGVGAVAVIEGDDEGHDDETHERKAPARK
jgi:hypothetical protein